MTPLYQGVMELQGPNADFLRELWRHNPWILRVNVGIPGLEMCSSIIHWCDDRWGPETSRYGAEPHKGQWFRSELMLYGWAWFGFDTEENMKAFMEVWQDKVEIESPEFEAVT